MRRMREPAARLLHAAERPFQLDQLGIGRIHRARALQLERCGRAITPCDRDLREQKMSSGAMAGGPAEALMGGREGRTRENRFFCSAMMLLTEPVTLSHGPVRPAATSTRRARTVRVSPLEVKSPVMSVPASRSSATLIW